MAQILIENITKTFKVSKRKEGLLNTLLGVFHREHTIIKALDSISFEIDEGELVGYIGPNGAGKSTTIKILSGILVPDSGQCKVLGRIPWKERIEHVKNIGVVFGQKTQLWWDLPVIESFELLKDIYKIREKEYKRTLEELIEVLNIKSLLDIPVRQLSLGQRMRCELSASLIHSPAILFLDEPTIGLDAVSKLAIREFIKRINVEKKITIILTTHDMDDIETLCSRIIVIGNGKILYDGTMEGLRKKVSRDRILIIDIEDGKDFDLKLDGIKNISNENSRWYVTFDPEKIPPSELIFKITNIYNVKDLFVENPPIEEIIARFYQEQSI
ncbi:ATP-binding cassette domain-containing protein [bacterium]|nr:ATP-binding cassette domain-containing protein [bacterium]